MGLLSDQNWRGYARRNMPAAKVGTGPWGEAVKYWLPRKNLRQADLARITGIEEKTISSIARGFDTTTKMLRRIAVALGEPLEEILVSPDRRMKNEDRERIAREVAKRVLRELDERNVPIENVEEHPEFERALDQTVRTIERVEKAAARKETDKSKKTKTARKNRVKA